MKKKSYLSIFLLFLLFLMPPLAYSQEVEGVTQDRVTAVIDYINPERSQLVAGDLVYKLSLDLRVVSASGKELNRYALSPGNKIEFNPQKKGKNNIIDAIKILKTRK